MILMSFLRFVLIDFIALGVILIVFYKQNDMRATIVGARRVRTRVITRKRRAVERI